MTHRAPEAICSAYADAGFLSELLPIIPPGATLTPTSKLPADKLGKAPGRRNASGWAGFARWTTYKASGADVAAWDQWGAGLGLQGRSFPAIDIDVEDRGLSERLAGIAIDVAGPAPCRHVLDRRTGLPGARRLLLYRGENLKGWPSIEFEFGGRKHMVEMKGAARQCVMEGRHPKGGTYAWVGERSPAVIGAGQLTVLTESLADELREAFILEIEQAGGVITSGGGKAGTVNQGQSVDQDSLREPKPGATARVLDQCPNDVGYEGWVCVLRAAKASGGEEAYEAVEAWSLKWPDNTPESVREKWDSLFAPHQIGWPYLSSWATSHGVNAAAEEFEPVDGTDAPSGPSPTDLMFQSFVWVDTAGAILDLRDGELLDRVRFNVRNSSVGDPSHAQKCAWAVFLRDTRRRRSVKGLTYRPSQPTFVREEHGECANSWRAPEPIPEVPSSDADVARWLDHLAYVIESQGERETLLNWLAWVAQNQAEKPNWGVLVGGAQGVGKSLLIEPLRIALGRHNVREIGPSELAGSFNGWLANTKLVVVEEMHTFDKRQVMNGLKPLTASPPYTHQINPKYGRPFEVPNIQACLFFTNHTDALALERGDRRFFVLWSKAYPREEAYYRELAAWYRDGGAIKAARWLLDRDLTGFDARGRAPSSAAKEAMTKATRSRVEEWLEDGIADASEAFAPDVVSIADLLDKMPPEAAGRQGKPSPHAFAQALKKVGARSLDRVFLGRPPARCSIPTGDLRQARLVSLRHHDRYAGMSPRDLAAEFWTQRAAAEAGDPDDAFNTQPPASEPGSARRQDLAAIIAQAHIPEVRLVR